MPRRSVAHRLGEVDLLIDGEGPVVVLVHGVSGNAELNFGAVVESLAMTHTVVRPNLTGSGATVNSGADDDIDTLVEDIVASIAAVTEEPVALVGFSLGAAAAAATAAAHPQLVHSLVLAGGWATSTGPRDAFYFDSWQRMNDAGGDFFKRFVATTGYSPGALDAFGQEGLAGFLDWQWPEPGVGRQIAQARHLDILGRLPDVVARTLVVAFGADTMVPPSGSVVLHRGIAGSELVVLDGEGHLDWLGRPDVLFEPVRAFLAAA